MKNVKWGQRVDCYNIRIEGWLHASLKQTLFFAGYPNLCLNPRCFSWFFSDYNLGKNL